MRKRRFILAGVAMAVCGFAVAYNSFGHKPLARYIANLRANGDYVSFSELASTLSINPGSSTVALTNAAIELGQCPVLISEPKFRLMTPDTAAVNWHAATPPPELGLTNADGALSWSEVGKLVSERATILADLRTTLKEPRFHANMGSNYMAQVTPYKEIECCSKWLCLAAIVDLHEGRARDASANVNAIMDLANVHREEYRMVSYATRLAAARAALSGTWELLASKNVQEQELSSLQESLELVDLLEGLDRSLQGERCRFMEVTGNGISEQRKKNGAIFAVYAGTVMANDVHFGLRTVQGTVECARELQADQPWPEVERRYWNLMGALTNKLERPERYFYLLSLIAVPNYSQVIRSSVETEVERRLTITAIALTRYRLKHGSWPTELEVLVPEFLPEVPRDCMSGESLCYRLDSERGFVLYSVGKDGTDSGGDPTPQDSATSPDFWARKDAVWPSPGEDGSAYATTQSFTHGR